MPNPARLVVYGTDNKPLNGSVSIGDPENSDLTGSDIHEFSHQVYIIEKDLLYSMLYGADFIRQHKPLSLLKVVDKMSVPLRSLLLKGTFIPKVEIRWYTYLEDYLNLQEYFRMTMEHVRLHNMTMILPDVKDTTLERYEHLEQISFCYQKITWLYTQGNLLYTDIWNGGFFSEEDEKDFGNKIVEPDLLEEMVAMVEPLVVSFTSGQFDIAPEDVVFGNKAKVTFTATFSRKSDMNERKVYARLFAVCNGKTEDLCLTEEGRLSEEGAWSATFTLKKPALLAEAESSGEKVEYYAVIENKYASNNNYKSDLISTQTNTSIVYFVTDDNEPMGGETVYLLKDGEAIKEYTTDSEGKIEVEVQTEEGEYGLLLDSDSPETKASDEPTKDWIEVELQDEDGNLLMNEPFDLIFSDGSKQSKTLDEKGFCRVENVPSGSVEVVFANYPSTTIKE